MSNPCQYCGGRLQPIGHDRLNGRDHPDWPTRKYHKKCWKEMRDNGYEESDDDPIQIDPNRLSKIDGLPCCNNGCDAPNECMCMPCPRCKTRAHQQYLDCHGGICVQCDMDDFMRKEGRFICCKTGNCNHHR